MALSNDFEARRRARLKEQRLKKERANRIKRIALIIICLIILIILITNIAKCGSKKKSASTETTTAVTTVTEAPTAEPEIEPQNPANLPAPKEGENDFLDILKNSGQTKKVYLTFEDGPDKTVTPEILDVLRRYNVKATFFLVGKNIESDSNLCTRIMEEGHLALPLSYSGSSDTLYASKTDFIDEIDKTYDLICDSAPTATKPFKIYRFPGGSTSARVTQAYRDALAENGYFYCDWNASVGDDNSTRTAEQLNTYFTTNMPQLNNLVVQLHNTANNEATAQMLDTMIRTLLDDGYSFNRLDKVDFSGSSEEASTDDPDATEATSATPEAQAPASATNSPAVSITAPPSTGSTGSSTGSAPASNTSGSTGRTGGSTSTAGSSTGSSSSSTGTTGSSGTTSSAGSTGSSAGTTGGSSSTGSAPASNAGVSTGSAGGAAAGAQAPADSSGGIDTE